MSRAQFQDREGRTWQIQPLRSTFLRIDRKWRLPLTNLEKFGEIWPKLTFDNELAFNVIWTAIEDQAGELGIEAWSAAMDGERLDAAVAALLESLCEYHPRHAELIRRAAAKINEHYAAALDQAIKTIDQLPDSVEEMQQLAEKLKPHLKR